VACPYCIGVWLSSENTKQVSLNKRPVFPHNSGSQDHDPGVAGLALVRAVFLVCRGSLLTVPAHGLSSLSVCVCVRERETERERQRQRERERERDREREEVNSPKNQGLCLWLHLISITSHT
jgi:hypothetical protein